MMRRHFLASSLRRTFRNQLSFSIISSSGEETMEGSDLRTKVGRRSYRSSAWSDENLLTESAAPKRFGPIKRSHKESLPIWKKSIAAMLDTAQAANDSAAVQTKAAANAIAALRKEFELEDVPLDARSPSDYELIYGDDPLSEHISNDGKKRDQQMKERLEMVLDDINKNFLEMELKKDIKDREKSPLVLPIVENECKRIADLAIEESLIIFVASSFFGENGQDTGIVSHALFYAFPKGEPVNLRMSRNLSGNESTIGPHSLEYAVQDAEKTFPSVRYKIFCEHDCIVKCVQERIMKLKAEESVPDDQYTTVVKALIATDSSIEVIASDGNLIARYMAYMVGKIGAYMDDKLEFDEARILF